MQAVIRMSETAQGVHFLHRNKRMSDFFMFQWELEDDSGSVNGTEHFILE
jgi:hypothetical protein